VTGGLDVLVADRLCTTQAPIMSRTAMTMAPQTNAALVEWRICRGGLVPGGVRRGSFVMRFA
jgi:hypothetical protein